MAFPKQWRPKNLSEPAKRAVRGSTRSYALLFVVLLAVVGGLLALKGLAELRRKAAAVVARDKKPVHVAAVIGALELKLPSTPAAPQPTQPVVRRSMKAATPAVAPLP